MMIPEARRGSHSHPCQRLLAIMLVGLILASALATSVLPLAAPRQPPLLRTRPINR